MFMNFCSWHGGVSHDATECQYNSDVLLRTQPGCDYSSLINAHI